MVQATLALSRYAAVCTRWVHTTRLTVFSCLAATSLPFLLFLLPLTGVWGRLGWDPGSETCTILPGPGGQSFQDTVPSQLLILLK